MPQNPNRYQGPPTRYGGSFSAGWYTSNGYPVSGPPWSQLVANPEVVPAVYQVNGRQYIAFAVGASWGTGGDPAWRNPLHRKEGKIDAQGYHVFALPNFK